MENKSHCSVAMCSDVVAQRLCIRVKPFPFGKWENNSYHLAAGKIDKEFTP
jgi:hypothetical protein